MNEIFPILLAAAEAPAEGQNMLQQFGIELPYFIAQCLHFLIVVGLLYFLAFKPVMKTMSERQEKIADGLQYAEEMKAKLADAEKEHAARLQAATAEAQKILGDAKDSAAVYLEKQTQQAAAKAEDMIRKAREATELERQKMLADVRGEVARLVVETSEKVLAQQLSADDRSRFAEKAATELAGRN